MLEFRQTRRTNSASTENRRQKEDNLAVIFMAIVIGFLVCHFPRIFLSLHEMLVIKNTMACTNLGHYPFPLWAMLFAQFSHLLLVLNSSLNSVIYCMVSSKYRAQAVKYLRAVKKTFNQVHGVFQRWFLWCQNQCCKPENAVEEGLNVRNTLDINIL